MMACVSPAGSQDSVRTQATSRFTPKRQQPQAGLPKLLEPRSRRAENTVPKAGVLRNIVLKPAWAAKAKDGGGDNGPELAGSDQKVCGEGAPPRKNMCNLISERNCPE